MAFGDLIKSNDDSSTSKTAYSTDLGSNPATGNLLIITVAAGSSTGLVTTPPSGFTLLHSSTSGSGTWYWYYKISDGTEQVRGATWDELVNGVMRYIEYEWDGSTPVITKNENTDNISDNTNSQASGAATPTNATNICLAAHFTDGNRNNLTGQAVDGSWIEDFLFLDGDINQGEGKVSRLVNAALSSQEATHSDTDIGDQMYGAIAIFDIGGIAEIANSPAIDTVASATSITVTHGMTFADGNVIIVTFHSNNVGLDLTAPVGKGFTRDFTEQGSDTNTYAIFSKVSNGTEDASWTFDSDGAAAGMSIIVRAFSGVDSSIWDITPSAATRAVQGEPGNMLAVAPTMVTLTDGALGFVYVSTDTTGMNYSAPTNGYGNEAEETVNRPQVSYTRIWDNAGNTGTVNVTLSTTQDWTAHQFALKLLQTDPVLIETVLRKRFIAADTDEYPPSWS